MPRSKAARFRLPWSSGSTSAKTMPLSWSWSSFASAREKPARSSVSRRASPRASAERGSPPAARLVDGSGVNELLRRKYGRQKRLVDFLNRKSRPGAWTAIEIADA